MAMMDKETKREMWFLAIGTAVLEAPVVATLGADSMNGKSSPYMTWTGSDGTTTTSKHPFG
jgi:hypothetical protein